jgi:hypothetical protein
MSAISQMAKNGTRANDSAKEAVTQDRLQFLTSERRADRERLTNTMTNRKVLELLDRINDSIKTSAGRNSGGLLDSALDLIGIGGRGRGKYRNRAGRFIKRPGTFFGRVGAKLGLRGAATEAEAVAGTVARTGRAGGLLGKLFGGVAGRGALKVLGFGGRLAGKLALPVAAGLALADGVNGVRHSDELLGRKSTNLDKIGVGVTEAVNGALFGLPDLISKKVFGVGFSRGINALLSDIGGNTRKAIAFGAAGMSKLFSSASQSIVQWFSNVQGSVDAIIDAVNRRDWGKVPGLIGKVLKYTTPLGIAITAGKAAVNEVEKVAPGTKEAVRTVATNVATAAGNAASNVAGWFGLGSTSRKYESGRGGAGTVSSGRGDPGGASYGTYQLASKTGTLASFLKSSGYDKQFMGLKAGTKEFNDKWKEIARTDPKFGEAQHDFIKRTHYDPAARYAQSLGFDINDKGIADAIWSASVQHGGVKTILRKAAASPGWNSLDNKGKIKRLYEVRTEYARNILVKNGASSEQISSVQKRYTREVNDALALSSDPGSVQLAGGKPVGQAIAVSQTMAQAKATPGSVATTQATITADANKVSALGTQRGSRTVSTEALMPPMPPPKKPEPPPPPVIVQQVAPDKGRNNAAKVATNAAAPQPSTSGQLPPLASIPTVPSLELLAIASLAYHPA